MNIRPISFSPMTTPLQRRQSSPTSSMQVSQAPSFKRWSEEERDEDRQFWSDRNVREKAFQRMRAFAIEHDFEIDELEIESFMRKEDEDPRVKNSRFKDEDWWK